MKTYCISFEGIDKAGKWQVLKYVDILANHKYVLMDRGLMSNITYARIYKRDYQYDVSQFKDWVFVYLFCDEDDWNVRCKLTNEPAIDYTKHKLEFDKTYEMFTKAGFKTLSANTSHITPYNLALEIIRQIEELNKAQEILDAKEAADKAAPQVEVPQAEMISAESNQLEPDLPPATEPTDYEPTTCDDCTTCDGCTTTCGK